jgi:alpha-glucosidase (family GH31 glycosyl hydrolase)
MIVSLLKLRKQLQPYIVELFNASTHFGDPIMRPMAYDFEDDPNPLLRTAADQYVQQPSN